MDEESVDYSKVSRLTCDHQCRLAVSIREVDVGTVVGKKTVDDVDEDLFTSDSERCSEGGDDDVWVGVVFEEDLNDVNVPVAASHKERALFVQETDVGADTEREEEEDEVSLAVFSGDNDGDCMVSKRHDRVDSKLNKQLDKVGHPLSHGVLKHSHSVL